MKFQKIHGMFGTPEYKAWAAMIQRCTNPSDNRWKTHGARGIKVCNSWFNFINFYKDMGNRPSPEYSLDRIDNDGDYNKINCRWATKSQQQLNKRIPSNNTSGYKGVYKRKNRWEVYLFLNKQRIYIGKYINLNDAIQARKDAEIKWKTKI